MEIKIPIPELYEKTIKLQEILDRYNKQKLCDYAKKVDSQLIKSK